MTCQAKQYSDQMACPCGNRWDVNDPSPPACKPMTKSEDLYAGKHRCEIELCNGQYFDFNDPNPTFDPYVIAKGLSKKCRFNGQCNQFYSVAEHSVLVVKILNRVSCFDSVKEGLLHDANEAYLPDVPSPLKQKLPDLRRLEHRLDVLIRDRFRLPTEKTMAVTFADNVACVLEAMDLMPSGARGIQWDVLAPYRETAAVLHASGLRVRCLDPEPAAHEFLMTYNQLFGENL